MAVEQVPERKPSGAPMTSDDPPMTREQAAQLKALADQALEPEAFTERLTRSEAVRRIETLRAKLRLQDGPPHTL